MSDWRLDIRELHRIGGEAKAIEWRSTPHGRRYLIELGLVEQVDSLPAKSPCHTYRLTPRGWDVAEGRMYRQHQGPNRAVWRLTWWSALPRPGEIRLGGGQ